jgi:trimethylamine--corrinoid protein Co-methyltransferase
MAVVKRGLKGGQLRLLTEKDAREIHIASLEVLEKVGMHSPSERILKIFEQAGAKVDHEDNRVWIPQHLVEESLRKVPKELIFCGRNPKNDILLEDGRVYFGMGGTPTPYIRDIETEEMRRPTKRDVADATRVGDALPNIDFIMSIAGAFDVPYQVEYLNEFDALFNNTEKPILYSCPGAYEAKKVLEMASAIAGGMDALRKRPIFALYTETVSPLAFAKANENLIEFAEAGIPYAIGPIPMLGATSPMTLSGTAVISNAESLAGITLGQLVNPHTPVIYTCWATPMDPVTSRCSYGAPEFALGTSSLCAAMAQYYDLPSYGFGGCSDSKLPDAQAGAEAMMTSMMAGLCGVNLIHDHGYLAGGSIGSIEMAVICDEIIGMVSRLVNGVTVNDDTLAVEVIKAVGPGGHFMSQKHTLRHLPTELFFPKLFDKTSEVTWAKAGKKDISAVSRERAKKIVRDHLPEPLSEDASAEISRIIRDAESELVK